jgi:hypothetical protein
VVWLADHRWWTLGLASVLLLLRLVLSRSFLGVIPVELVLFLLFFASLMALAGHRGSPRPPSPH